MELRVISRAIQRAYKIGTTALKSVFFEKERDGGVIADTQWLTWWQQPKPLPYLSSAAPFPPGFPLCGALFAAPLPALSIHSSVLGTAAGKVLVHVTEPGPLTAVTS